MENKKEELDQRMQNIGGKGFVSKGFQQVTRPTEEIKPQNPKSEVQPQEKSQEKFLQKTEEKAQEKPREILQEKKEIKVEPVNIQKETIENKMLSSNLAKELEVELSIETAVQTLYSKILYQIQKQSLSRKELSLALGQKNISGQLNQVILKLLEHKLIEHTIKAVPNHPQQKFKMTDKGLQFLRLIENAKSQ